MVKKKNPPAMEETWFSPWVRKISWRREWLTTPVFLPGKSHGQWSLTGYNYLWGHKRVRHDLATKQQQQQNRYMLKNLSHPGPSISHLPLVLIDVNSYIHFWYILSLHKYKHINKYSYLFLFVVR